MIDETYGKGNPDYFTPPWEDQLPEPELLEIDDEPF